MTFKLSLECPSLKELIGDLLKKGEEVTGINKWDYWEEIEKLKETPLYSDSRYDAAVEEHKEYPKRDLVKIAKNHFEPEYSTLSFMKKAELLTNIDHCRVDTIAH